MLLWVARNEDPPGGKMILKPLIALFLVPVVAACGGGNSYSSYPSSASYSKPPKNSDPSSPTIKNDNYSPSIEVNTEPGERGAPPNIEIFGLFGKVERSSGKATAYVQWNELYIDKEWRFYTRASSSKGQPYQFNQVGRDVSKCDRYTGCIYSETYNIYLPPSDLRGGANEGISFKIYSKNGQERVVRLSPSLVTEFNEKMAEAAKMRGK